ncbi:hypothetical protein [Hymenobacter canadensis]|uniref:Uncharacterized protein n=1 Tax=Hymenobacter canadensis TaxID=2999067 RepID=A0ABY7LWU9_9BACT|nr:hypothetical protein [Hymenobacter canadensis]WBA44011.1 hypothetical protein O3303_20830 [Hymenobacter canadensis]
MATSPDCRFSSICPAISIAARRFADWSLDFGFAAEGERELPTGPAVDLPGLSITSTHRKRVLEVFIS